jgi:hypothetical protein
MVVVGTTVTGVLYHLRLRSYLRACSKENRRRRSRASHPHAQGRAGAATRYGSCRMASAAQAGSSVTTTNCTSPVL